MTARTATITQRQQQAMRPLRAEEKQWLFEPSALDHTPSRSDGITGEQELKGRREAILYMRSLWLRVAPKTEYDDAESTYGKGPLTVGATLVHRFYMRRSMNDFEAKLIAPVMLFLASKIEEAPLRLRHIVNACLAKFEPMALPWDPERDADVQPLEYRRWEKDILATEEVALEALCFDMIVQQPWPILWRGVKGLDSLWLESESESSASAEARATANGHASPNAKGKSRASQAVITEVGWAMLNEGLLSPLPTLYAAPILAVATLALILAMVDEVPVSFGLSAAAEIGGRFGLDTDFDEKEGAKGEDMVAVKDAIRQYIEYCDMGLIDSGLAQYLVSEPTGDDLRSYHRRFKQHVANGSGNGQQLNGKAKAGD